MFTGINTQPGRALRSRSTTGRPTPVPSTASRHRPASSCHRVTWTTRSTTSVYGVPSATRSRYRSCRLTTCFHANIAASHSPFVSARSNTAIAVGSLLCPKSTPTKYQSISAPLPRRSVAFQAAMPPFVGAFFFPGFPSHSAKLGLSCPLRSLLPLTIQSLRFSLCFSLSVFLCNLVFASLRFSPRSLRLRVEPTPSLRALRFLPNLVFVSLSPFSSATLCLLLCASLRVLCVSALNPLPPFPTPPFTQSSAA